MTQRNEGRKYLKLEPPKIYYFISEDGDMWSEEDLDGTLELKRKNIGNYFESEEEVRKAYKKLLAWKRLKEAGFKIKYYETKGGKKEDKVQGCFAIYADCGEFIQEKDLDLLFSQEDK